MPLPLLQNWDTTANSLHQAAQLIGGIRSLLLPHVPNWLELALRIKPEGLSSEALPGGSEIILDFTQAALKYRRPDGEETLLSLNGNTQAALFQKLLKAMQDHDLAAYLKDVPEGNLIPAMFDCMNAGKQNPRDRREELAQETLLEVDSQLARAYGEALYRIFTAIARFRAHLNGHLTPIVVWPHHFDLSTLWFADGEMDDHKAHINIGFAPFSPGFERPYLYAYAYPYPPETQFPELPSPARWHFEGWKGIVVDYDSIAAQENPEAFVEQLCAGIFNSLRTILEGK